MIHIARLEKRMLSEIRICKDKKLIEIILSGLVMHDELRKEGGKLKQYALENGKMKYLVDSREAVALARIGPVAMSEPLSWWMLAPYCEKIAFVIPASQREYFQFLEMVGRNAGVRAKVFLEIGAAKKWLGIE